MSCILGIDTSNYTTSVALFDKISGKIFSEKQLLPVQKGEVGLRQSDAVFHHVKQLPDLIKKVFYNGETIDAVGVSIRPRDVEGSYMPCFLVGQLAASSISTSMKIPLFTFSHQAGHIMAAVFSTGQMDLLEKPFIAFHVSGGTTECLLVKPDPENIFKISLVFSSLDLKAGQAVDRVGNLLGLSFPAGPQLEEMALRWDCPIRVKPTMKGGDCCLSGIENQCQKLLKQGVEKEYIARYCIESINAAIMAMAGEAIAIFGELPVLCAGGVMSNTIIRKSMQEKFGAYFAQPSFSSDNACGIAILTSLKAVKR